MQFVKALYWIFYFHLCFEWVKGDFGGVAKKCDGFTFILAYRDLILKKIFEEARKFFKGLLGGPGHAPPKNFEKIVFRIG